MRPTITSLQNARVKNAVQLRQRRARERDAKTLVDGSRELLLAIESGIELTDVFFCRSCCAGPASRRILKRIDADELPAWPVAPHVFSKLSFGQREEGVVAVARTPHRTLAELQFGPDAVVAVLEAVEKPGNVGAVVRTAEAAGISALIIADAGTDLYNPNTIRSSLGAVFSLPVCSATARETLDWLRASATKMIAARVDAPRDYAAVSYLGRVAIVLGSEARGLSGLWAGSDVAPVRLPVLGAVDSLNVSAAAAVLFYEALRQRSSA